MKGSGATAAVGWTALPTETPDDQTPGCDAIYGKRQFDTESIVLCVRWYITYRLS